MRGWNDRKKGSQHRGSENASAVINDIDVKNQKKGKRRKKKNHNKSEGFALKEVVNTEVNNTDVDFYG